LISPGKPEWDVDVVSPGSLGSIGLLPGDEIRWLDKAYITPSSQVAQVLNANAGRHVVLKVGRGLDEEDFDFVLPGDYGSHPAVFSPPHEAGILEILPDQQLSRSGLGQSIREGNVVLCNIFITLGELIHEHELQKSAGGPIMMYQATGSAVKDQVETGFRRLSLVAELSLSLAIFNLLPIPILDGGHILALFIEWLRHGKKMTEQQQQAFLMTGLAIIAVLVVCIYANDILRTVRHQVPQ
jgi:regulator of sigma E protease